MKLEDPYKPKKKPIMVLGTSSGSGKSLTTTAICRILKRKKEHPLPFKAQNMSNNAWVDENGGEMAYSQAIQAFAADIKPLNYMNPILLKPKGNSESEIIHLGEIVGSSSAKEYYKNWFNSGWEAIEEALRRIHKENKGYRLVIEGAGSPVEINLKHRDLTNMKIASHLQANCILVADIERGGVFAQIIGTLELLSKEERKLIKGILINRFRGDISLFDSGKKWLEEKTKIPVIGIVPWLDEKFFPEDSLDILERKNNKINYDLNIGIIKYPFFSNFSDFDALENESSLNIDWISKKVSLDKYDLVILPGSKQTLKDKIFLDQTGLSEEIKEYVSNKGNIIGICGGLQILGEKLFDPYSIETDFQNTKKEFFEGLGILPIDTIFEKNKVTKQREITSLWPIKMNLNGFELRHGVSNSKNQDLLPIFQSPELGWYFNNGEKNILMGTYLHGIFDSGKWRRSLINIIRRQKNMNELNINIQNFKTTKNKVINNLADAFENYCDFDFILK